MKIGIVYGSSRPSAAGEVVANWVKNKANFDDNEVELIDLAEQHLPMVPEATSPMMVKDRAYETASIRSWSQKVSSFDAVLFIVAEYNLGYTPILKNAVDVLYHEWTNKKVAFISYGSYLKSTAVEQLRVVMSAPKAIQVNSTLHISPSYKAVTNTVDESMVSGDLQTLIDELIE